MRSAASLFLILALLAGVQHSLMVSGNLHSSLIITMANFSERTGEVTVTARIAEVDEPLHLTLMRDEPEGLVFIKEIGELPAGSPAKVTMNITSGYPGSSARTVNYAIVGTLPDGTSLIRRFSVYENWEGYERSVRLSLGNANIYIVPLVALFLILVVFFLVEVAYHRKIPGLGQAEYTLNTLFFPLMRGRPLSEKIADLFINPFTWLFECGCVLLIIILIRNSNLQMFGDEVGTAIFVMSGVGAATLPVLYLALAWYSKRYEQKPLRFFVAMFCWGMFAAFLSFSFSSFYGAELGWLLALVGITAPAAVAGTALLAPVVEEVTKGIGVLFASGHHEFDDALTGMLLAFTCGVGFSFVENWFYFASKTSPFELGFVPWLGLMFYRSLFNSLAHGCFTASIGATIGYIKSRKSIAKYAGLGFLPGLFAAIALHMMFNLSALLDSFAIETYRFSVFIFNPMLVVLMVALFAALFVLASRDEMRHVEAAPRARG